MAAFADTAFGKDTAFDSGSFDFGAVVAPTGPAGADLSEWRRKTRYRGTAGTSLREAFEETLAHPHLDGRSKEYRRLKQLARDDDEVILLLLIAATLYD